MSESKTEKKVEGTIGFGADADLLLQCENLAKKLRINKSELVRRAYLRGLDLAVAEIVKEQQTVAANLMEFTKDKKAIKDALHPVLPTHQPFLLSQHYEKLLHHA